jgi:dTDP-4-dehydrorhamnose reductase
MRILVAGASGLVGSHCHAEALARGHEVLGTFRSTLVSGLVHLDLKDSEAVRQLIGAFRPDAIICCAAWSWVDGCEGDPARAFAENRDVPARLAEAARGGGARVLHFSSSYVFNGESGPYSEDGATDPLSVYARSKLAGESAVQSAADGQALIVRTMGVFGIETLRKNFVYQVIGNLSSGKPMRIPSDQLGNATHAADLAKGSVALIEKEASGIWNLAGNDPNLNRVAFARFIAERRGLDSSLIQPVLTWELNQPAKRPLHAGLNIGKALAALNWKPENLDQIPWEAYSK